VKQIKKKKASNDIAKSTIPLKMTRAMGRKFKKEQEERKIRQPCLD